MAWLLEWGWVLIALAWAALAVWELRRQAQDSTPPPWPGSVRARPTVEDQAELVHDLPRTCPCGGWYEQTTIYRPLGRDGGYIGAWDGRVCTCCGSPEITPTH